MNETEERVEDADEKIGRRMDPELLALSRIIRILEELDAKARERSMAYLSSRYRDSSGDLFRG